MKQHTRVQNMVLAAFFLALAYVMPFLTGQIQAVGQRLCPLHIPVLLCGFFCGPLWGLAVGFIAPLLRSVILGMPHLFPNAVCMAFELAVYGSVSGLMHGILPRRKLCVYLSLLTAMVAGRVVWGAAMLVCMGLSGGSFSFAAFLAGAVTNALPGIAVQLVLVPVLVMVLDRHKVQNGAAG